jgi:tetratricopeptide (TPR) repeat protein
VAKLEAEKKKKAALAKLVLEGDNALAAKDFEKAAKSLAEASKLAPDNEDIKRNLAKAQKEANKILFEKLLQSGKDRLKAKEYQKAVADLTAVLKLFPEDKEAVKELKKAQTGLDRLLAADAKKREAEARKKARKDADQYVKKGKAALAAKKYNEAAQMFALAAKLFPNDSIIESWVKKAQAGLTREAERLKKKQEAEARIAQQKAKREAEELVKKGRKALADKLYQEAVTALTRAQQLFPNPSTLALLRKAEKGLKEIQLAEAARKKQEAETRRAALIRELLKKAKLALNENRLDEAEKALNEALKLSPNDPDILALLKEVRARKKAIQDKINQKHAEERRVAEAARKKRHDDFEKKMTAGNTDLKSKKFDPAIKHFQDALAVVQKINEDAALAARAKQAIKDAKEAKDKDLKLRLKLSE